MRKLSFLLITLVACFTLTRAEIIKRVNIGDLYYNLDTENKTAEVTSENDGYWSTKITTADIPSSVPYNDENYSVTSIGMEAFWESDLTSIICKAVDLPTLGDEVFSGVPKNIPLYVPDGKESAYNDADQWKKFDIKPISAIPTGIKQTSQQPIANSQKLIKNGQLLILRDGKVYNVMGGEVK